MRPPAAHTKPARVFGVTMKDVAARAGVSTATVSRVLNDKGEVSRELEQRVRKAVRELDYRPNQAARRLRERHSRIIGILVPDIQIPFFAGVVVSMEKVLQEAGYLLLLGNTFDTLASEQQHLNIFLSEDVSGVLFAAANSADLSNYQRLQEAGIPLVAFDRTPGDLVVDSVQIANAQAAAQAVNHLIQDGHHRIALITGTRTVATAIDRKAGYEQALQAAGLPVDPALIHYGDYVREGGYQAMKALMAHPIPPTAVLVSDTGMTLGALQRLNELALEIPCDISLITFDDMPWATAIRPPLTVVAQPANEIGVVAARLMLDRIGEPESATKHVTLEARLIIRSSCSCSLDKSLHPITQPAPQSNQRRTSLVR